MPNYIYVYLGGEQPTSPDEGQKHMVKYHEWLAALGEAVVSPAIPFKDTHTVQPDGTVTPGDTTAMSGMTILSLNSMEDALEAAKSCPFLEINGTLEVSELIDMNSNVN